MKRFINIFIAIMVILSSLFSLTSCEFPKDKLRFLTGFMYDCKTCYDEVHIKCEDCDGEKKVNCSICDGEGMRDCIICSGTGRRICIMCGGMGGSYQYDYFTGMYSYKSCYSCIGGYSFCPAKTACSCDGGKVDCSTCGGRGLLDCPDC